MKTPAVFVPIGLDKAKLFALMREHDLGGILLTSPENVYYTTGYTALPSSGNPILYSMKNNLPFYSYLDSDGQITQIHWFGISVGQVALALHNITYTLWDQMQPLL